MFVWAKRCSYGLKISRNIEILIYQKYQKYPHIKNITCGCAHDNMRIRHGTIIYNMVPNVTKFFELNDFI